MAATDAPPSTPLHEWTASELARALATGEVSSLEVVNHFLDRISARNSTLNAFTYVAHRRARRAASRWDRERRRGRVAMSSLSGVPTAVKDLALVRGMPTRFGSRALPPLIPIRDGLVTRRMRESGMILLGKLATAELGALPVTEPAIHGPTRNAFDEGYSAGGSSGGSGAAVAAGLLPIAQGSDGAGSIRIPCALGHLVGLKPTRGLISHVTPVDRRLRLTSVGPLAQTTEDLASFLDAITDRPHHFRRDHARLPASGLRVAVSTSSPHCNTVDGYRRAAEAVAMQFENLGAQVESRDWLQIGVDEFLVLWKRLLANAPWVAESRLQPVTAWLRREGKKLNPREVHAHRQRLGREILAWFGDIDIWISPTVATCPPRIGEWKNPDPEASFHRLIGLGVYTAPFNISGQPAITIPAGFDERGLPIGVQLASGLHRDLLLLQAAAYVESSGDGFTTTRGHR